MLSGLIKGALAQRMFVLAVTLAVLIAGAFAALRLPIDAFPDISTN